MGHNCRPAGNRHLATCEASSGSENNDHECGAHHVDANGEDSRGGLLIFAGGVDRFRKARVPFPRKPLSGQSPFFGAPHAHLCGGENTDGLRPLNPQRLNSRNSLFRLSDEEHHKGILYRLLNAVTAWGAPGQPPAHAIAQRGHPAFKLSHPFAGAHHFLPAVQHLPAKNRSIREQSIHGRAGLREGLVHLAGHGLLQCGLLGQCCHDLLALATQSTNGTVKGLTRHRCPGRFVRREPRQPLANRLNILFGDQARFVHGLRDHEEWSRSEPVAHKPFGQIGTDLRSHARWNAIEHHRQYDVALRGIIQKRPGNRVTVSGGRCHKDP